MRLLFAACFSVTLIVLVAILGAESGTCGKTNVCSAIKALETKLEAKLEKLRVLLSPPAVPASSCKELYRKHNQQVNKAYVLQTDSGKVPVYCHMSSHGIGACGGGGWTLVMKTDGHKSTFRYQSPLWTNRIEFNLPGGKTGFDLQETKLPTYWSTPFSKICLGMKVGHQMKFIVINRHGNSMHSLIADGHYRATSLGRNTWKMLFGSLASLQLNCNREGFNTAGTYIKMRIGILGNNENDCITCDSTIGFGASWGVLTGNMAKYGGDNGDKLIKAMGYILVQ